MTRKDARRMRQEGLTYTEIARLLGISRQTARRWANGEYGRDGLGESLEAQAERRQKRQRETLRLRRLEWPIARIARSQGVTRQTIYRDLEEAGDAPH